MDYGNIHNIYNSYCILFTYLRFHSGHGDEPTPFSENSCFIPASVSSLCLSLFLLNLFSSLILFLLSLVSLSESFDPDRLCEVSLNGDLPLEGDRDLDHLILGEREPERLDLSSDVSRVRSTERSRPNDNISPVRFSLPDSVQYRHKSETLFSFSCGLF